MAHADSPIVTTEPEFVPSRSEGAWQIEVRDAIRDPAELVRLLELPGKIAGEAVRAAVASGFPLFVPRGFVERIERGNPTDPLLRQVLPREVEVARPPRQALSDPVGDQAAAKAPGLLQKYAGRALLLVTQGCPIHCRYCFRRVFLGAEGDAWDLTASGRSAASIEWLRRQPEIEEVILSGGDPLMLPDRVLGALSKTLGGIAHLRTLRLHTRMPILVPERVDEALLAWIGAARLRIVVVLHSNHPNEWNGAVRDRVRRFAQTGALVLNQAVLLRGVNDEAAVLAELSQRLLDAGVLPYYLHHLDPVIGAAHFEVPVEEGRALMAELRARLPGYAVPRYVVEQPGEPAKTPLV